MSWQKYTSSSNFGDTIRIYADHGIVRAVTESEPPSLYDIQSGRVMPQPPPTEDIHGEQPDIQIMDVHELGGTLEVEDLGSAAGEFVAAHPSIIEKARDMGSDVVAYVHENKQAFVYIGVGIAAVFGVAGLIIHRHRKHGSGE
ncbi:hypothetical protein A2Z33_06025 [Candidatus Gottesmanbacteria bacterium RBG_16_52_11]|uniref:Uncharacterized protein n=1 Tax=Candidatus Gottesmanbacteria bacterium RBG_16_52_11 TaxID=1798374 RepID=A0A1F5YXI3_9BACT|nr:MAG: hypothetical protein A2Z33_06025 [Candidatus Gottesmanbacteria bacterium RBG_16_52_11]